MYPSPFEYHAPSSVGEAIELLQRYGDEAKVLSGGQSLIPMMNLRLLTPAYLVDINGVENGTLQLDGDALRIPALARQRTIEYGANVREHCPILADAVRFIGNVRVRTRGTVGGNLAHADPSSELSVAALASGASVTITGPNGSRGAPLSDLFVTYMTTSLELDELITELRIPVMGRDTGWAFLEMARRAGEFAIVNVAALVTIEPKNGSPVAVSAVLGGVADTPVDVSDEISEAIVGSSDAGAFAEAGSRAASAIEPRSDIHASSEYRKELVRVYTARALELAYDRAQQRTRT
ncbi:MAG: xanthine dehydrogenase family protein subunit M [Actinomycetota bacterium]|nr:xanthine dehydrogenase family protein subunit M [Actinomycetota bacterium]